MTTIYFSPVQGYGRRVLSLSLAGDALTIAWRDGKEGHTQTVDFSVVPEGAELPAAAVSYRDAPAWWLQGVVTRIDGALHICIVLPHGEDAPEAARFPSPVVAATGDVTLPECDGPPTTGPKATSRELPDPFDPNLP
jgi:hypothetical protein